MKAAPTQHGIHWRKMRKLLNPPEDEGWVRSNYDKLLHISITFMMLAFLDKLLPLLGAVAIVLICQLLKTVFNYCNDDDYHPTGDWIANIVGYASYLAYWLMKEI